MTPLIVLASVYSDEAARRLRRAVRAAGGLVTAADLARRWHISKARAHELTRQQGFPLPVAQIGRSSVYIATECDHWRAARFPDQEVNDA